MPKPRRVVITNEDLYYYINNPSNPDEKILLSRLQGVPVPPSAFLKLQSFEVTANKNGTKIDFVIEGGEAFSDATYKVIATGSKVVGDVTTLSVVPCGKVADGGKAAGFIYVFPPEDGTVVTIMAVGT